VSYEPTINTIIHENARTTIVLSAVAKSESVFLIPHFARIDVSPAKNAENIAEINHIASPISNIYRKVA
jgi:hypothetical protein